MGILLNYIYIYNTKIQIIKITINILIFYLNYQIK